MSKSNLVALMLFAILAGAGASTWWFMERQILHSTYTRSESHTDDIANKLQTAINFRIKILQHLSDEKQPDVSSAIQVFLENARSFTSIFHDFRNLHWISPSGTIIASYQKPSDQAIDHTLKSWAASRNTEGPWLSSPYSVGNDVRMNLVLPSKQGQGDLSFFFLEFSFSDIVRDETPNSDLQHLNLVISDGMTPLFKSIAGKDDTHATLFIDKDVSVLNRIWHIEAHWTHDQHEIFDNDIEEVFLVISLILAAFISFQVRTSLRTDELKNQQSARRFSNVTQISYDWMWEMSSELRFSYISERFFELTGHPKSTYLGKHISELIGSEELRNNPSKWQPLLDNLFNHQPFRDVVITVEKLDHIPVHIRLSGKPVFSQANEFEGYVGVGSDISAEIAAKAHVEKAVSRLSDAIESSSSGFALFSGRGQLIIANSVFSKLLSNGGETLPANETFVSIIGGVLQNNPHMPEGTVDAIMAQLVRKNQIDLQLPDGRWIQLTRQLTSDQETIVSVSDITALKEKEALRQDQALAEQVERLGLTLDSLPSGVAVFDASNRLVAINRHFFELLHINETDLPNSVTLEAIDASLRNRFTIYDMADGLKKRQLPATPLKSDQAQAFELNAKDGSVLDAQLTPQQDGGRIFTLTDITSRKKSEVNLRLSAEVVKTANEGIMIADAENRILFVNPAFCSFTGYTPKEVIGRTPKFLRSGRHNDSYYRNIRKSLESTGKWQGEIWNRRKNGEFFAAWLSLTSLKNPDGSISHFICISHDITVRKEDEERIWRQANYDALTGLPNRVLFHDRMDQSIRRSERDNSAFALVFIDLDGFKQINDTLGHAAGDLVLQTVGTRLQKAVRSSDTVARLAGDEFTVILQDARELEMIPEAVQKLLACFQIPIDIDGSLNSIHASLGVAVYPDDALTAEELIRMADMAMYQAKSAGKNRIRYISPEWNDTPDIPEEDHLNFSI